MSRVERLKAKQLADFMHDDITFCSEENCENTACVRNQKNIQVPGVHSYANFKGTEECPLRKERKLYNDTAKLLAALKSEADNEFLQKHSGVSRGLKKAMRIVLSQCVEGELKVTDLFGR